MEEGYIKNGMSGEGGRDDEVLVIRKMTLNGGKRS